MTQNASLSPEFRIQKASWLPPWIWFWLLLYLVTFSSTYSRAAIGFATVFNSGGSSTIEAGLSNLANRFANVIELVPSSVLFLGVLTLLFPWARAFWLSWRYDLRSLSTMPENTLPETLQKLEEIQLFLHEHAPGVVVKYPRSARFRDYAMVYPLGYRQAAIAVSGRVVSRWRTHRQEAEAILFHEIAHYRQGDTLVIGAGSLLTWVAKNWFWLTITFLAIPLALVFLISDITTFQFLQALPFVSQSLPVEDLLLHFLKTDIPLFFLAILLPLFWSATLFIPLLVAIWCAELNADRFVLVTTGTGIAWEVSPLRARRSKWRWLFESMSHPPQKIRTWVSRQSVGLREHIFLLLLFPLAFLARLLFLAGWALSSLLLFLSSGIHIGTVLATLGQDILYGLEALVPIWLGMSAVLLFWPVLAGHWERIFFHACKDTNTRLYSAAYLSSGFAVLGLCLLSFVLSLTPIASSNDSMPERTSLLAGTPLVIAPTATFFTGTDKEHDPLLKQTYQGMIANTTDNTTTNANIMLSDVKQDQQGHIHGYLAIGAPLLGSGPCTGSVTSDNHIQLTVVPDDNSGYTLLVFTGIVNHDGSLSGTYTLPGTGQGGTWKMQPQ